LIWSNLTNLYDELLELSDVTLFVDGSVFIDRETGRKHAGFGIVSLYRTLLIEQPLPEHCSGQQAELLALTEA
jgi:ribonuclease HI